MAHRVTLIPGDGTGPELTEATRRVVEATGVEFDWDVQPAGEEVMHEHGGNPLPDSTLVSIRENGVALKGPITTPVGGGFRSVNVALRKELDMYAQVRPCKTYPGVRTRFEDVDLIVVRENTEDLYAGIEFEIGQAKTKDLIAKIQELSGAKMRPDSGVSIKPISVSGTERIVKAAFEYALKHGRKKVTAVHKSNIMKYTDGLYLATARKVAERFPQVAFEDRIVDNMAMQLVQRPEEYDILLCPNLYGDILSDLCAALVGGLGVAPGMNLGREVALFEAVHGSAPQFKGQDKLNPTALILTAVLMLEHLNEHRAAERVQQAVRRVIEEGKTVTSDLGGTASTTQMTDAILAAMKP